MVWELFVEKIPWVGMGAVEVFTAVVMNGERLNTDKMPWSVVRRLIINLFTTQPVHRASSDKVTMSIVITYYLLHL